MARSTSTSKKSTTSTAGNGKSEQPKRSAAPAQQAPSGAGWFTRGGDGYSRKQKIDEVNRMRKEKGVPRFYLKPTPGSRPEGEGKDNEARLVFLDSTGFWIHEHNLKLEGKWGNFFTCTKDFQPCEICNQLNDKSIFTCYYTVIDTRKFVKKDGTVSKHRRVLLPAKGSAIDVIEELRKQHGDLRGLVVDVKRLSDRDPNCGRDFSVVFKDGRVARIDPSKKFEGDLSKPYDYMKVLAPPTAEELTSANVSVSTVVGSDDDVVDGEVAAAATATSDEDMSGLLGD